MPLSVFLRSICVCFIGSFFFSSDTFEAIFGLEIGAFGFTTFLASTNVGD
jgi:hypothetical protein